jgi:hypothetical protein
MRLEHVNVHAGGGDVAGKVDNDPFDALKLCCLFTEYNAPHIVGCARVNGECTSGSISRNNG